MIALSTVAGLLSLATVARADDAAELTRLIDDQIQARLDSEGVHRAPTADDAEFLRRVFLDLHGVVPSTEQAAKFLDSSDPDKRARLIEELLASPRFGGHLADLWGGRLLSPQLNDRRKQEAFTKWLADRFNSTNCARCSKPLDSLGRKVCQGRCIIHCFVHSGKSGGCSAPALFQLHLPQFLLSVFRLHYAQANLRFHKGTLSLSLIYCLLL
jgi:hypothetical protein